MRPLRGHVPAPARDVARLNGRPFALLSVMTDEDVRPDPQGDRVGRDHLDVLVGTGRDPWPDPASWNVRGYPTVYVLDHKGVIRLKFTGYLAPPGPAGSAAADRRFHRDASQGAGGGCRHAATPVSDSFPGTAPLAGTPESPPSSKHEP